MELSAQQLADILKGEVIGDSQIKVNNLSKIEEGVPGTLTFLANPKYSHYIYTTKASVVLVHRDFTPEENVNATMIRVDDPYACLAMLLNMVAAQRHSDTGIDENTVISPSAAIGENAYIGAFTYIGKNVKIGKNAKIYPQCYIGDNVTIGDDVLLYPGVKIYYDCHLGNRCTMHAGVVIGGDGFGFAPNGGEYVKIAQIGNVIVEDDVEIGSNTTIDRATMGSTIIHKGVKLDNLIQIAHNVEVGSNTVMAAQCGVAGSTKIGSNNMIGGQVGIAGHITVGDNILIGAQSGIPNSVESGSKLMGYPAVDRMEFAKQTVYIKKLSKLYAQVDELKKQISELKNNKI